MLKKILTVLGVLVALILVAAIGGYIWASGAASARLNASYSAHEHDFPIPMALTEGELESLRAEGLAALEAAGLPTTTEDGDPIDVLAEVDLGALARERAEERGRHLVESRYVCIECHGVDFSGGVMVDDPAVGTILGPNITSGEGSPTQGYTPADWDRIVRHGIRVDGRPAIMPSEDFVNMSDQELSDIVAYIQSFEPVDVQVPELTLGPLGKVLVATGQLPLAADAYADRTDHMLLPPEAAATVEFGAHVAQVCTGCHKAGLNGGSVTGGPPDWAPAANLTTGPGGVIDRYDFAAFDALMRTGAKPDGTPLLPPMDLIPPYAVNYTDTEMRALWAYIESLEPLPMGE